MGTTKRASAYFCVFLVWTFLLSPGCLRLKRAEALKDPAFVLERHLLCADLKIQAGWAEPSESKSDFKKGSDKNVFSFICLKAMVGEHRLYWKWYDPSRRLYRQTEPITIGKGGQVFETYIAWDQIFLFEEKASGTWTVAVFIDDRLLVSKEFGIQ